MSILHVKNLVKSYGDITVVNNISFHIEEGDVLGLVGPNGAGKSTTINMISGLLIPDNGDIIYENSMNYKKWRTNIGLVPQDLAIYNDLTAKENVIFFASLYGLKGKMLEAYVNEALEAVGLLQQTKKRVEYFSGGMKRRLNIACGIVHKPKLIIMDEPTVGIDSQSRTFILDTIKKLQKNGTTVIYTSHYMEEVEEICNKILIIDHGEIILTGTTNEVKSRFNRGKVLVMQTNMSGINSQLVKEQLENIVGVDIVNIAGDSITVYCHAALDDFTTIFNTLQQFHIAILSVESKVPTLEEIFLSLTGKELRD
jgi:ABC-2 type transport system ATP-binding protein